MNPFANKLVVYWKIPWCTTLRVVGSMQTCTKAWIVFNTIMNKRTLIINHLHRRSSQQIANGTEKEATVVEATGAPARRINGSAQQQTWLKKGNIWFFLGRGELEGNSGEQWVHIYTGWCEASNKSSINATVADKQWVNKPKWKLRMDTKGRRNERTNKQAMKYAIQTSNSRWKKDTSETKRERLTQHIWGVTICLGHETVASVTEPCVYRSKRIQM